MSVFRTDMKEARGSAGGVRYEIQGESGRLIALGDGSAMADARSQTTGYEPRCVLSGCKSLCIDVLRAGAGM